MGQHVIARQVRLGVLGWPLGLAAADDLRLDGVGHGVAMGRVTVPGLEGQHLAHLAVNEGLGALQSGIEALHVPDLKNLAAVLYGRSQAFSFFDGNAKRFFAEDMFAGLKRCRGRGDMKRVGRGDDDGIKPGVG